MRKRFAQRRRKSQQAGQVLTGSNGTGTLRLVALRLAVARTFRSAAGPQPKNFSKKEEGDRQWYDPGTEPGYRGCVAQVSNLLQRRPPVGRLCPLGGVGGLEIRDTAGWKPALEFGHYRGLTSVLLLGTRQQLPDRQRPGGVARPSETPKASLIPAQGNALGLWAKDHSER
jgi:hypothetical protein